MDRVYIPKDKVAGGQAVVDGESRDHLVKSLRVRVGDRFLATDGEGRELLLETTGMKPRTLEARVVEERRVAPGIGRAITLALCPPKGSRMETAVEKCAEMGAGKIVPLLCTRSVVKTEEDSARVERWRRIARSAMVQSEQCWSLEITAPRTMDALLDENGWAQLLLAHPAPDAMAIDVALAASNGNSPVTLLVGPEGGFTDEEVNGARKKGARTVTLGATRLRSETAAIVALALALDSLRRNSR
ncbi:MAG TPA: RsmE family RNA methyltransferase [bacterium]|nr:RsmE family RNA methyltransferase [bacterium]